MRLNYEKAKEVFVSAAGKLELDPTNPIRLEWKKKSLRLNELCPYRKSAQIRVLLCCTLLAKATDVRVNVRNINVGEKKRGTYNARYMADNVVAPMASDYDIDIGSKSPNPLNSNAFVNSSVRLIDDVKNIRNQKGWSYFLDLLNEIEGLGKKEAFQALKGYFEANKREIFSPVEVPNGMSLFVFISNLIEFIEERPKNGACAQALVAACMDLLHGPDNVITRKLTDPDRHYPCDVNVLKGKVIVVSYEVKFKPISYREIKLSLQKMGEEGQLPSHALVFCAFKEILAEGEESFLQHTPVPVSVLRNMDDLLSQTFLQIQQSEESFIHDFVSSFAIRLEEIDSFSEAEKEFLEFKLSPSEAD